MMKKCASGIVILLLTCNLVSQTIASPLKRSTNNFYCTANDPCWPSEQEFSALNETIDGNLIVSYPPAWSCHYPNYNQDECAMITENWQNSTWRSYSTGYQDTIYEGNCTAITPTDLPCTRAQVPYITALVENAQHVQSCLEFVKKYRLRLRIKGASHDYNGRSAGEGSFAISTSKMDKPFIQDNFTPQNCKTPIEGPVLTTPAATRFIDAYTTANQSNREIVGGSSKTVGISGGWVLGGGHSSLSRHYGLGVDNVVEFEVITTDGQYRVVNECSYPDLFWALRGGGGGIAIILSSTFKTYPSNPTYFGLLNITAQDYSTHVQAITTFMENQNEISAANVSCNAFLCDAQNGPPYNTKIYVIIGGPNVNAQESLKSLEPVMNMNQEGLNVTLVGSMLPSYADIFRDMMGYVEGGYGFRLASRLITPDVFHEKEKVDQIAQLLTKPGFASQILLVGGGKTHEFDPDSVAASPEWRSALAHTIVGSYVPSNSTEEERNEIKQNVVEAGNELGRISSAKGSYINEDSIDNPDKFNLWWGSHYEKIRQIKQKYDPEGILNCMGCVGEENGW